MSVLNNLFKIWRENFDPNDIKCFIDENASQLILSFKQMFNWIEVEPLLEKLWGSINQKNPECYDWEFLFIRLIKEVLTPILLNKIGRVKNEILKLSSKWFEYLISRTISHLPSFPADFCTLLHTSAPVSDTQAYKAQEKRLERIYEKNNLMNAYNSGGADIIEIVEVFEQNFGNQYPLFLSRCKYLGDEWGKHESKTYGNDLNLIFQLRNINDRTPPNFVRDTIIELIHVRNAPSHKDTCGIIPVNEKEVRIRDRKADGTLTYDKTIPKEDLWKFFYKLLVLDRGLTVFALYLDLYIKLRQHDQISVIILNCSCGKVYSLFKNILASSQMKHWLEILEDPYLKGLLEKYIQKELIIEEKKYLEFGFTDIALMKALNQTNLLLTVDFQLIQLCRHNGLEAYHLEEIFY